MNHAKLTQPQLRHIWALSKELNIKEEYLYCIVFSVTGSESISSLTKVKAKELIKHLIFLLAKNKKKLQKQTNLIDLNTYRPTEKQRHYAVSLARKINQGRQKISLEELSQRMFHKSHSTITKQEMIAIIEALKSILSRRTEKHA